MLFRSKGQKRIFQVSPPYCRYPLVKILLLLLHRKKYRESSPLQQASVLLQLAKIGVDETIEPSEPYIDPKTGDWTLKEYDIECITGIMECGGGGNARIERLRALASLRKNKEIRVIHPCK